MSCWLSMHMVSSRWSVRPVVSSVGRRAPCDTGKIERWLLCVRGGVVFLTGYTDWQKLKKKIRGSKIYDPTSCTVFWSYHFAPQLFWPQEIVGIFPHYFTEGLKHLIFIVSVVRWKKDRSCWQTHAIFAEATRGRAENGWGLSVGCSLLIWVLRMWDQVLCVSSQVEFAP